MYARYACATGMLISGAKILVNCLEEQGIRNIFGYPGASILSVYDALADSSIRHVLTAHEQGACFAAEGYARRSGRAGVVLATSGPGATNLVTGLADAYMDSIPLVAITGNVPLAQLGHDSFQEVDIFDVSMPVTKYGIIVKSASEIAPAVRRAFALAESGRKGPVLVDIPSDILDCSAEYEPTAPVRALPVAACAEQIEHAAEMIDRAERPLIYAGGGAAWSGAENRLMELARKIKAPVVTSYMGIGCCPPDYERALGVLSDINIKATEAISECDLFITVGARFNSRYGAFNGLRKRRIPLLQLDSDKAEIDKNLTAAAAVVGDAALSLDALLPLVGEKGDAEWAYDSMPDAKEENRGTRIIRALTRAMGRNITVTTDVGLHQEWAAHNAEIYSPRRFLTSGGLGAMGFGMGAAIGAHFASGDTCLVVTGDGSFNMNFNELTTAVKHHVPLVVAVLNNNSLGMIRKLQTARKTKNMSASSLYLGVDYAALAEAMGARGATVAEEEDVTEAVERALDGALPVVIDFKLPINTGI